MRYTLNQVIKVLEDFASDHLQINQFSMKDPLELLNDKETRFPAMVALLRPSNIFKNEVIVNMDILFMDLVHKDLSNESEVLSDQLLIAIDLRAHLAKPEFDDYFFLNDNVQYSPFYEKGDSEVTGIQATFSFRINDLRDSCIIPTV